MHNDPSYTVTWNFTPYYPVRESNIGEVVFSKKWQRLMTPKAAEWGRTAENGDITIDQWFVENESSKFPILKMFDGYTPTKHQTRIASSLISWLGTNAGIGYRHKAQQLHDKHSLSLQDAHLLAWAQINIRNRQINYGRTYRDNLASQYNQASTPPTTQDHETLERVCMWLATKNGQDFINACLRNIQIKHDRASIERQTKPLKQNNIIK